MPLFTQPRRETVWKFGIALSSGCHLWVKGCEEALFGRLQRSDEDDGDPLQLFSKQFRKGNSQKLGSLYSCEPADSSSSTIFRPSIISKVKRTTPLSLPLYSK